MCYINIFIRKGVKYWKDHWRNITQMELCKPCRHRSGSMQFDHLMFTVHHELFINPYKHSILSVGHSQTVQTQIRRGSMRHLISASTICLQNVLLKELNKNEKYHPTILPGRVAQSVTCLATDACLTADPGVASLIPVQSHTFVEIDHEMISTVILLPSAESFKKGCCQLQAKVCARITG